MTQTWLFHYLHQDNGPEHFEMEMTKDEAIAYMKEPCNSHVVSIQCGNEEIKNPNYVNEDTWDDDTLELDPLHFPADTDNEDEAEEYNPPYTPKDELAHGDDGYDPDTTDTEIPF